MMKNTNAYPIVGRDDEIDLEKYTVEIHGRLIIDYEKLAHDAPELYRRILADENKQNADQDEM